MSDLKDIFKLEPLSDPGDEHIIPYSLGGRMSSKRLINRETNGCIGSTVEPALSDSLIFFFNALGLKSRRGRTAGYTMQPDNDEDLVLESELQPQLRAASVTEAEVEGAKHIQIRARTIEEARKIANGLKKKHPGLDLNEAKVSLHRQYSRSPLEFPFVLGGGLQHRAIAVMMFEAAAITLGNELACSNSFDDLRNWIWDGVKRCKEYKSGKLQEPDYPCGFDARPEVWSGLPALPDCKFQNRLFVFAGQGAGGAWAAFELLGHIRFTAVLSDDKDLPDGTFAYLADPATGTTGRPAAQSAVDPALLRVRGTDLEGMRVAVNELFASVSQAQRANLDRRMIQEVVAECMPAHGEVITEEHVNRLSRALAEKVVEQMYRIDSEEEIEFDLWATT